jgi:hypothetical protein
MFEKIIMAALYTFGMALIVYFGSAIVITMVLTLHCLFGG